MNKKVIKALVLMTLLCDVVAEQSAVEDILEYMHSATELLDRYLVQVDEHAYLLQQSIKSFSTIDSIEDCLHTSVCDIPAQQIATQVAQVLCELNQLHALCFNSPGVAIEMQKNDCIAQCKDGDKVVDFLLQPGDHNVWFSPDGVLWGYDYYGRVFFQTADGNRTVHGKVLCLNRFKKP